MSKLGAALRGHPSTVALVGIVLASLVFRLHVSRECSLWLDEVGTHIDVMKPWREVLRGAERVHPPLLFVLVKLVFALFGGSETSLRAVSLFAGCVLLVAAYWLCLELGMRATRALLVVVSFAISPFFIWHATEARHYALLPALGALATASTLRVVREPKRLRDFAGFAASAAGMATTHYFGLAYAVALLGVIVVGTLPNWRALELTPRRAWALVLVLVALFIVLGYVATNAVALAHYYAATPSNQATVPWRQLVDETLNDFGFMGGEAWTHVLQPLLAAVGLVLLGLSLRGVARLVPFGLTFGPCLGALLITSGHFVSPRYLAPSWVLYQIGTCAALFALADRIRLWTAALPALAQRGSALSWALLAVPLGLRLAEYPEDYGTGEDDYRGLQRYFREHFKSDTALVVFHGLFGQRIMGTEYGVGQRPLELETFRRRPGINRYLVAEIHVIGTEQQAKLESLVTKHFGLSPQAWSELPLLDLSGTTYQPPVSARLIVFERDQVKRERTSPRRRKPARPHRHRHAPSDD